MGRLKNEEKPEEEKEDLFRHFSHEHPLELSCDTIETGQIICVGCGIHVLPGKAYYACRTCRFSLHSACYNMPRKVHHPADPGHDLILLLMPSFACKACGKPGSGFAYNCRICLQSYHSLCSVLPLSTSHYSHPHILNIEFSPPYDGVKGFRCDVCRNLGYDHWLYRCGPCGFDVHLNCALSNQPPQPQMVSSDSRFNHRSIPSNGVQPNQNVTFVPANVQGTNQVAYYVQANGMAPMAPPQAYPGYYYGNQMAVNGQNQGGMNGMKGLLVGSVASGMGQAVAQEIVHSVTSGWGNGSGSSGNGDSNIASSWVGGGANYI